MSWLRLIYTRLYGLLRKDRIEQDMDDEMRFPADADAGQHRARDETG
jgi:hypothetical protein